MSDPTIFDRYATDYTDTVNAAIRASGESSDFFARLRANLVRRTLGAFSPHRILDFGCGVGNSTQALAEVFPAARVTGCDASPESIRVARQGAESMRGRLGFVVHDQSGLPLRNATFDVALASCVFHHIDVSHQAAWLLELRRVLMSGAPLFLFEHNPFNPLTLQVVRACPFDVGVRLLRPHAATQIVRSAGFRADRPRYYFFFPRPLRILRPIEEYMNWFPLGGQYYIVGWREA